MRNIVLAVTLAAITLPAAAADHYKFRVRVTDGRTGLLSNPDVDKLAMPAEQLERAAGDRVIVLDRTDGTHWRWLMLSWIDKNPKPEQRINDRGANGPAAEADLGVTASGENEVSVRCLREQCQLAVSAADRQDRFTLAKGQSRTVPSDAEVELTLSQ
jgi:hypothetical protein